MNQKKEGSKPTLLKAIGPGLLFAGAAIGTSHLVLATRAGAHHGTIYFWIILLALFLKYPFYEFGPRYANATGFSLLKGYRDQGIWAVLLFLAVISINMFAVTGAIGAVSAGLLASMFRISGVSVPFLAGIIIGFSVLILLLGGYRGLDQFIKGLSMILFITVIIAFIAVLLKGQVEPTSDFQAPSLLEGPGLALLIGLVGWMPAGMEASTMNSIWNVEKIKTTHYHPKLSECLFDFNLGYLFTLFLALIFMIVGAFTVYGTGTLLEGNATVFSNKLLSIFTQNLGSWTYYIIATAAFGTIYGTLITVLDAFPRCVVRGLRTLKYSVCEQNAEQSIFLEKSYRIVLLIVGLGGFGLFYFSAANMLQLLEFVTILSFLLSPIIAFLNLRAIQSNAIPQSHKPAKSMLFLAYIGLAGLLIFAVYYLMTLIQ